MTTDEYVELLRQFKNQHGEKYSIERLGIFGSVARGEQTAESDLDVLIEFKENTPNLSDLKESLRREMQRIFRVSIDICREKYIKPIFRKQILSDTIYV